MIWKLLNTILAPLLRYTSAHRQRYRLDTQLYELATVRAIEATLEYVECEMPGALMFKERVELWDYALSKRKVDGVCAEFGVWKGQSINYFAKKLDVVYGFDSFEGLQEDWSGWSFAKGAFDVHGKLPKVANNVHLIKGWFDRTLPGFLGQHAGPFGFVHIDSDTFEAATLILELIGERLVPGTILIFDEYFGYRGWRDGGEFKAWGDWVRRTDVRYEYLAFSSQQVVIRIVGA